MDFTRIQLANTVQCLLQRKYLWLIRGYPRLARS
jgi:hypothetical protein